jgi:hypothetical protein
MSGANEEEDGRWCAEEGTRWSPRPVFKDPRITVSDRGRVRGMRIECAHNLGNGCVSGGAVTTGGGVAHWDHLYHLLMGYKLQSAGPSNSAYLSNSSCCTGPKRHVGQADGTFRLSGKLIQPQNRFLQGKDIGKKNVADKTELSEFTY